MPTARRRGKMSMPLVGLSLLVLAALIGIANVVFQAPIARASSYNRSAAVNYADFWAHARNVDFYGAYTNDCANFASQVMEAGGIPEIPGNYDRNNTHQWWVQTQVFSHPASKTWTAVDWQQQYFSNYQGSRFQYVPVVRGSPGILDRGDVLNMSVMCSACLPDHARVLVGYGNSAEAIWDPVGTYGLLADSHTNDRYHVIWDDGLPSWYPLWGWHVVY